MSTLTTTIESFLELAREVIIVAGSDATFATKHELIFGNKDGATGCLAWEIEMLGITIRPEPASAAELTPSEQYADDIEKFEDAVQIKADELDSILVALREAEARDKAGDNALALARATA